MKRTLIALLALFLAAAGLLTAGTVYLTDREDAVELTHTLIAGDPAAAEGVTLTLPTGDQRGRTCWETAVDLGTEELAPETEFTFYPNGRRVQAQAKPSVEIYTGSTSFGMSSSGGIDFAEYTGEGEMDPGRAMENSMMVLPAADIAERTENGETRTETLRLSDYYDYYPIAVDLYLPDAKGNSRVYATWEECQALTDYFQMEVPEDLMVEVSVTKDEYGQVSNVESNDTGEQRFWFRCDTVVLEDGVCLSITVESEGVEMPDVPVSCRDGFGIYFIPFSEDLKSDYESGDPIFDLEHIRMFCPLDWRSSPLLLAGEEGQMLLYAREDGTLKLSVFDTDTWQCVQWESIFPLGEEENYSVLGSGDGFRVMARGDGFFRVVEEKEGVYTPALSGTQDTSEGYVKEWWYSAACGYDGERLVLSGITGSGDCSCWVQVYEEEGLTYGARIDHSLDREDAWNSYEYREDSYASNLYPLISFRG